MAQGRSREFGQLIPQDDGDDTICYRVTIPNTSEWRILFHSLVFHWTSGRYWKRTATGRQITDVQAKAWEIYNALELCDEENGTTDPTEIEIITIVKECKMSCNCCTCNGNTQTLETDMAENVYPEEIEVSVTVPPTTIPPDSEFEEWKCKCAQHILTLLTQVIQNTRNLVEIGEANYAEVLDCVTATLGAVKGGLAYIRLWEIWLAVVYMILHIMTSALSAGLTTWISNNRVDLYNLMFCSTSGQDAQTKFREFAVGSSGLSFLQKQAMNIWIQMIPFEALYQDTITRMTAPDFDVVIANYENVCVCPIPMGDFNLPVDYQLIPMIADVTVPENGGTFTDMENMWQFIGGGNAGTDITLLPPQFNLADVPNANRRGFLFQLISTDIQQEDAFGHNLANSSTQFSQVSFGNAPLNWLPDEVFAGSVPLDATLQAWLAGETFRHKDALTVSVEEGDVVCRFLHYGDNTGNPPLSTSVLNAWWIINTVGL